MRDVSNSPIFIRLGSRNRGPKDTIRPGAIRRVMISNVVVFNADPRYSSIISGIPGVAIEDVTLQNIRIYSQGGGTREQAALEPPEKEDTYPEPSMFGDLPAYGFFLRHVKGLQLRNIQVNFLKSDMRPAFWLNNVADAEFFQVQAKHESDSPTFQLRNVSNFALLQSWPFSDQRLEKVDLKKF